MIYYRDGYKYQLAVDFRIQTPVVGTRVSHKFFDLFENGVLVVYAGYAWDGASGPTFDTESSMAPSLVHDVLCQMMRLELIEWAKWHDIVSEFFHQHLRRCGMGAIRAWYWYRAVKWANAGKPDGNDPNPVLTAPSGE